MIPAVPECPVGWAGGVLHREVAGRRRPVRTFEEGSGMPEHLESRGRGHGAVGRTSSRWFQRVAAIRGALDGAGHADVPIMSYAAEYAFAFYGPFRDAADSAPARGRPSRPPDGSRQCRRGPTGGPGGHRGGGRHRHGEAGAANLDIIHRVKRETGWPVAAYHVSGEYAALMAAAERGWLDEERVMMEALTSIARAGADIILTYWARQAAERL
jgi:porphobilinogen synthase